MNRLYEYILVYSYHDEHSQQRVQYAFRYLSSAPKFKVEHTMRRSIRFVFWVRCWFLILRRHTARTLYIYLIRLLRHQYQNKDSTPPAIDYLPRKAGESSQS
eukprot:scaffold28448_cov51-Attheya_sp.AAC.1